MCQASSQAQILRLEGFHGAQLERLDHFSLRVPPAPHLISTGAGAGVLSGGDPSLWLTLTHCMCKFMPLAVAMDEAPRRWNMFVAESAKNPNSLLGGFLEGGSRWGVPWSPKLGIPRRHVFRGLRSQESGVKMQAR